MTLFAKQVVFLNLSMHFVSVLDDFFVYALDVVPVGARYAESKSWWKSEVHRMRIFTVHNTTIYYCLKRTCM